MENQKNGGSGSHALPCSPLEFSRETPIMNEAMNWPDRRDLLFQIGTLERKVNELAAGLRETLALLNHSDTSYPQQEGWWSYERAREMESILPENEKVEARRDQSPTNDTL